MRHLYPLLVFAVVTQAMPYENSNTANQGFFVKDARFLEPDTPAGKFDLNRKGLIFLQKNEASSNNLVDPYVEFDKAYDPLNGNAVIDYEHGITRKRNPVVRRDNTKRRRKGHKRQENIGENSIIRKSNRPKVYAYDMDNLLKQGFKIVNQETANSLRHRNRIEVSGDYISYNSRRKSSPPRRKSSPPRHDEKMRRPGNLPERRQKKRGRRIENTRRNRQENTRPERRNRPKNTRLEIRHRPEKMRPVRRNRPEKMREERRHRPQKMRLERRHRPQKMRPERRNRPQKMREERRNRPEKRPRKRPSDLRSAVGSIGAFSDFMNGIVDSEDDIESLWKDANAVFNKEI